MPNPNPIANQIQEFIFTQFPLARQREVNRDTSLINDGIVDSLGILEIVTFMESEFGLTLNDEEMLADHFDSIASLTTFVVTKLDRDQPISA